MKKAKQQEKKPKIIKFTPEQLAEVTAAIRTSNLDSKIGEMVIHNISGNRWLVDGLEKGDLTIKKLRKLFGITTESFESRRKNRHHPPGTTDTMSQTDVVDTARTPTTNSTDVLRENANTTKPMKGHGRLHADAYEGAEIVDIDVPNLKPGDTCPEEYCDGRLYEMSDPGVFRHGSNAVNTLPPL